MQMAGAGAAGGGTAQTSGSAASVSTALASVSTALASASTDFAAGWRGAAPSGQSLGLSHGGAAVAANTAVAPPPLAPQGGFAAAVISGFSVQSGCPSMAAQWCASHDHIFLSGSACLPFYRRFNGGLAGGLAERHLPGCA